MSTDEYDVDDSPFPIIRGVFEDVQESNSVRMDDLRDFINTISLQAVADGRVTVLINRRVVFCSLGEVSNEFIKQFRKLHLPALLTFNGQTSSVTTYRVNVPKSVPSVTIELIGAITGLVHFQFVTFPGDELPEEITYPLVCIGFPKPQEKPELVDDFEEFTRNRIFPLLEYDDIVKRRTKAERRNREFLIQTNKTRTSMVQRYNEASATYKKRQRQLEMLHEKITAATNSSKIKQPNYEDIAETIERIDNEINILVETTDGLSEELDLKSKGKQMSRREELELLHTLQQQVRDSRSQLEVLIDQSIH